MQREKQTEWLADLVIKNSDKRQINILGKTFKPETNLLLGSPSILLENGSKLEMETVIIRIKLAKKKGQFHLSDKKFLQFLQEEINIENKNNIADTTGAETNKKIPDLKRKLPVLILNIVLKRIFA